MPAPSIPSIPDPSAFLAAAARAVAYGTDSTPGVLPLPLHGNSTEKRALVAEMASCVVAALPVSPAVTQPEHGAALAMLAVAYEAIERAEVRLDRVEVGRERLAGVAYDAAPQGKHDKITEADEDLWVLISEVRHALLVARGAIDANVSTEPA